MAAGGKGCRTTPKTPKTVTTTKKRTARKTSKHPTPELVSLLSTATSAAKTTSIPLKSSLWSPYSPPSPRASLPLPARFLFILPLPSSPPSSLRFPLRWTHTGSASSACPNRPSPTSSTPSSPLSPLRSRRFLLTPPSPPPSSAFPTALPTSSDDACRVFYTVCKAINENLGNLVEFRENLERIVVGFGWISLPNCCGVLGFGRFDVDGELLGGNGSLLVQALVDSEGRFLDISAGWPSRMKPESILYQTKLFIGVEESRDLLNGPVYELGDGNYIPQYILGDCCFPLMPWLITPYVRNDEEDSFSSAEKEFNVVHSRAMGLVGNAFERVKSRWQLLGRRWKEECIEFLPYVIVTGCLLHNFLIKFSEPLPDDDVGCLKEEELPVFEGEVDETGRGIRDFLAEHLSRVSLRR
ncbi:hypothetical protein ACOSQ4_008565 [Xanthoceras sorbifolium]